MLTASFQNSVVLWVGFYGAWFITGSFTMDSSSWQEWQVLVLQGTGLCGCRQSRPTTLTQVLFLCAAPTDCLIAPANVQFKTTGRQLWFWQDRSFLWSMKYFWLLTPHIRFLPAESSRQQRIFTLWVGFFWTFISQITAPCQAWISSREQDLPPHSLKILYLFFFN